MPALDGMRVLDMTQAEAGTTCSQWLGWMGADVVKIEPPTGDRSRGPVQEDGKVRQYFLNYNGNKRSIVFDFTRQEARDTILRMVPRYDVFVENYGPGVCERFGLTYERMKAVNPGIIYARIKGFGTWGPYSSYNAIEWIAQSAGGTFSITGDPDGPPTWIQPSFADSGTGAQTALAIIAAYVRKLRTGKGESIELAMQEAVSYFMKTAGTDAWGEAPQMRKGNRPYGAPSGIYRCKGDDPNDYATMMVFTPQHWEALCAVIQRAELVADPRFATPDARAANDDALREIVADWCLQRTKHQVMEAVAGAGIPCSAILTTLDLHTDPHLKERMLVQTLQHKTAGEIKVFRCPVLMGDSLAPMTPAPLLGEHTEEVLRADLNLTSAELAALRESGAIG